MVPDVVDTCRECHAWQKTDPDVTPAFEFATKRNDKVDADILFYRDYLIWHMIGRADSWRAATVVLYKEGLTLVQAMMTARYASYGPFATLVIDGESCINCKEGTERLKSLGIGIHTRAPGQHARMIARRRAILRHAMHTSESQAEREGININIQIMLAVAVFCGIALISYSGVTPYLSRFGASPDMLPDTNAIPSTNTGLGTYPQQQQEEAARSSVPNNNGCP